MSKKEEVAETEEKALEFDVMPGADPVEEDDSPQIDLSFETPEEEPEEEVAEETVAEEESEEPVAEESEETVAEEETEEPEEEVKAED